MMAVMRISTYEESVPKTKTSRASRDVLWTAASFLGFGASILFFTVALILSGLAAAGIVSNSSVIANVTVVMLITAFAAAYLGAHALDKGDDQRHPERHTGREPHLTNSCPR